MAKFLPEKKENRNKLIFSSFIYIKKNKFNYVFYIGYYYIYIYLFYIFFNNNKIIYLYFFFFLGEI